MLNNITTLVCRAHVKLVVLSQKPQKSNKTVTKKWCSVCGYRIYSLFICFRSPPTQPYPYPPHPRFSSGAGMPDIQELKEATELWSRLQTVSEAGVGRVGLWPAQHSLESRIQRILSFGPTVLGGPV